MSKLTAGDLMPDFSYVTPFAAGNTLADTVKRGKGKTAVVFLRYFGCDLCQYDMQEYAAQYDRITAAGGQLLVVLQSDPAKLASQITAEMFPFEIICDPDQVLYRALEIGPAKTMGELVDEKTEEKIKKVELAGFQHGDYEGEELQLPAAFVIKPDLTVTYAHYGNSAGDVPTPAELAELLA